MSSPASATEPRAAAHASPSCSSAARSRSRRASCTAPAEVAALLPADTCVYIPSLPGLPLARTLEAVAAHPRRRPRPGAARLGAAHPRPRASSAISSKRGRGEARRAPRAAHRRRRAEAERPVRRQPAGPRVSGLLRRVRHARDRRRGLSGRASAHFATRLAKSFEQKAAARARAGARHLRRHAVLVLARRAWSSTAPTSRAARPTCRSTSASPGPTDPVGARALRAALRRQRLAARAAEPRQPASPGWSPTPIRASSSPRSRATALRASRATSSACTSTASAAR